MLRDLEVKLPFDGILSWPYRSFLDRATSLGRLFYINQDAATSHCFSRGEVSLLIIIGIENRWQEQKNII